MVDLRKISSRCFHRRVARRLHAVVGLWYTTLTRPVIEKTLHHSPRCRENQLGNSSRVYRGGVIVCYLACYAGRSSTVLAIYGVVHVSYYLRVCPHFCVASCAICGHPPRPRSPPSARRCPCWSSSSFIDSGSGAGRRTRAAR